MTRRSRGVVFRAVALAAGLTLATSLGVWAQNGGAQSGGKGGQNAQGSQNGQGGGSGGRWGRGFGAGPGGARGVIGSVTAVAADHYMVKSEDGTVYTVYFSVNTRMVKGGAGPRRQGGGGQGDGGGGERPQPQAIKATDIKVGDVITAGGELDEAAKSIGAVFIAQMDPERVKEMRQMEANYGKTWLAGRVTGVEGTTITIEGAMDHAKHAIEVDENTSFHKRRESVTLADIQPGMQLRAEGAVAGSGFRATSVTAMEPRRESEPGQGPNPGQGPGPEGGLGGGPSGPPSGE